MRIIKLLIWFFLSSLLWGGAMSCKPVSEPDPEGDIMLAKVYNKELYLSEVVPLLPGNLSPGDSLLRLKAQVERWVREALMMHEAERNIPKDLNIDQLVRDYRASLILYNYEKLLIDVNLDSLITPAQLLAEYEENRDQYPLQTPIIRCNLIRISKDHPGISVVNKLWKSDVAADRDSLIAFCKLNTDYFILDDSLWMPVEALLSRIPKGTLSVASLQASKQFNFAGDQMAYKLRVLERREKNEIAPISYIEEQLKKVILHKRKLDIIHGKKEDLYEQELRRNNVEIFLD